jgi:hypothetical protein
MSDQGLESFWINIAAGVVLLAIVAVLKWSHARWSTGNPAYRRLILAGVGLCWVVLNSAYAYFFRSGAFLFILLSSAVLVWIIHSELNQFWRIGLVGADHHIATGIDFQKALRLVSSSLDFLGIGGAKLTDQVTEFEEAIGRCNRPDRPVRFLLCRPNHPDLEKMAQSANKEPALYKKTVHDSLRAIADLRNGRAWNIRVRFYAEVPTFRLMFVDDSLCLASYYVLGKERALNYLSYTWCDSGDLAMSTRCTSPSAPTSIVSGPML